MEVTETWTSCKCKKAKEVFDTGMAAVSGTIQQKRRLPLVRAIIEGVRLWGTVGCGVGSFSTPVLEVLVSVKYLAK